MTNHKTEAMNYLIASTIDTHGDDDRKVAIAQVHATIYLAEQQRIANLISFGEAIAENQRDGYALNEAGRARLDLVEAQIQKGLGL